MKIKFLHSSFVAGPRRGIIIDMIQKTETSRTENGEDFLLRYGDDGTVKIFMTDTETGGRCSGAWTRAQIIQKPKLLKMIGKILGGKNYGKVKTKRKKN